MSPTTLPTPPRVERKARARKQRRGTSLFAHGEPMVWLTGGALALALTMIIGLLALVVVRGVPTFWPGEIVRITTHDGRTFAGEVAVEESYTPGPDVLAKLDAAARDELARAEGVVRRRMLRTGNFDLTGTHFQWVSDFEIAAETRPAHTLLVERLSWGRFIGVPKSIEIEGVEQHGEPAALLETLAEHHDVARARWEQRRELETDEIGDVNAQLEAARLELREVESTYGAASAELAAARAAGQSVEQRAQDDFRRIQGAIAQLRSDGQLDALTLVAADGAEKRITLEEIVRTYPANELGFFGKIAVYASRVREFLLDDPREANSEGGVFPALYGTVLMTLVMSVLVVPFGVLAALYLREYAKPGPIVGAVRIAINNLAGVPSIVFGVFGLGFFCYIVGARIDEVFFASKLPTPTFGTGGLLWASLTLALLTLPVVIVPTEEALAAVPRSMREGSYACGATKWQTIWRIVLPRALPGIMTGMILALARGAGEVAPLMLVGAAKLAPELPLDGSWPYLHPERSFMHLGFHIYDLGFQSQNSEAAKPMVFTTTLLLIALVVTLNLLAITIRARLRRRFQGSQL